MLKLENLILLPDTVPVSWSEITNGPKVAKTLSYPPLQTTTQPLWAGSASHS